MPFMSSEALPPRTTITESNLVETKEFPPPPPAPAAAATTAVSTAAPPSVVKFNTPDAIFAVVPINPDSYGPYGKPNAIVRPLRRNETPEMTLPQANEANLPASSNHSSPKTVDIPPKTNKKRKIDTFTKELDNKLRHLQHNKISSKNVNPFHNFSFTSLFCS